MKKFLVIKVYSENTQTECLMNLSELQDFVNTKHPGLMMFIVSMIPEKNALLQSFADKK